MWDMIPSDVSPFAALAVAEVVLTGYVFRVCSRALGSAPQRSGARLTAQTVTARSSAWLNVLRVLRDVLMLRFIPPVLTQRDLVLLLLVTIALSIGLLCMVVVALV